MNKIYRCLMQNLPVAESAVFQTDSGGSLIFKYWVKDEKRPETESGYMAGGRGDSGSPIVKDMYDEGLKKKRHITIAVYNSAVLVIDERETTYSTDIKDKCRMMVSKLNSDVVKWLGLVMNYEKECETNQRACEGGIRADGKGNDDMV